MDALRASNSALLEEEAARSDISKRIIDSQSAYLKKTREWTAIGDQSYLNNVGSK